MIISRIVLLILFGVVISVIDVRTRRIPNRLNLALLILSLILYAFHLRDLPSALVTSIFFALILALTVIPRREGFGGGDMKLIVVLAFLLGNAGRTLSALILAGIMALLQIGALTVTRRRRIHSIAFAPALFIGALLSVG
jgi:leader peptidase (prepilin peptidase) / N-methyltransferase